MTKDLGVGGWLFILGIFAAIYEPTRIAGVLMLVVGFVLICVRIASHR